MFRPREMWAMKEYGSKSKRAYLNVLNSLSLKWGFIQYSGIQYNTEPVCLGILRYKYVRLANCENLDMFCWAKFVGFCFWIYKFLRFRKGNFLLWFWNHAICKSWYRYFFWLKTENTLWLHAYPQSAPFTIYIYIYIYPQSSASKLISLTRIGSLLCFCFASFIVILHRNSR